MILMFIFAFQLSLFYDLLSESNNPNSISELEKVIKNPLTDSRMKPLYRKRLKKLKDF